MLLLSNSGTCTTNKTPVTKPFQVLHLGVPTPNCGTGSCLCVVVLCTSHPIFFNIWCTCYWGYVFFIFLLIYYSLFLCSHHNILRIFSAILLLLYLFFRLTSDTCVFTVQRHPTSVQVLAAWLITTPVAALLPLFFLCSSCTFLSLCHIIPPSSVSYILLFPVLARNDPPEFTESLPLSLSLLCGLSCQMFRTHLWPWPEVAPGCQGGM